MVSKPGSLTPPTRKEPTRSDSQAIVEAILVACRELLTTEGEVSIRAVARRAGVGEASVHRYFPSKLALFTAVFDAQHQDILKTFRGLLETTTSLEDGVRKGVTFFAGFGERELAVRRSLSTELPLSWTLERLVEATNALRDVFVEWLLSQAPELTREVAEHRVFYTVAAVRGAVTLRLHDPTRAPEPRTMVETLTALVIDVATGTACPY